MRGASIAAVRDERGAGTSHLLLMESRGGLGGFRVASRATLDKEGFRGARWATAVADADGDGYDEIICTGTDSRDDPFSRRLVLYVPRTRQSYSMRVGLDSRSDRPSAFWSSNAGATKRSPTAPRCAPAPSPILPQATCKSFKTRFN